MSKLKTLRSQLASLRRSRQFMRLGTGYSALLIALLWILLAIFVIDFGFHWFGMPLDALQRVVLIALGGAAFVWAAMKYTAPFLGHKETDVDMALLVERQQGIDSDLVAALQFESAEADKWGSRQLEDAVVDYVAQLDRGLDVYEGISHERFWRRLGVLAVTVVVVVGMVLIWQGHAHAFLMRLALGNAHYPSNTQIERILVNGDETLSLAQHGTAPADAKAVQGRSVVFAAWAGGELPAGGETVVYPSSGGSRKLPLTRVDREDLHKTATLLERHVRHKTDATGKPILGDLTPQRRGELTELITNATGLENARIDQSLQTGDQFDPVLTSAWRQVKRLDDAWTDDAQRLYVGKLPRLLDPAEYSITLGDAWTDPASVSMIALPVVETRFIEQPPEYAVALDEDKTDPSALQRSVIEGSQLDLVIRATKPLQDATLTVMTTVDGETKRKEHKLVRDDTSKTELWKFDSQGTPLASIMEPLRFEIQVTDEDGLSLENPLRGAIRLKSDRPPRVSGSLVHRAVLPNAQPEVELRVGDDYGIAAMKVHVTALRGDEIDDAKSVINATTFEIGKLLPLRGNMGPVAAAKRPVDQLKFPLRGEALPKVGAYLLDLSSMSLKRGDEVRIVLEAIDYRGKLAGTSAKSEPIILDITDESGILAAVSEGDRRSQEQIDDLIRRQLGIGESP